MASLKKKKRKWDKVERPDTMDYYEALKDPGWDNERRWADAIMNSNKRLGLDFKLDKLTKGEGSCFPISVVQQLNRKEVYERITREDLRHLARTMDHHMLRLNVKDFICRLNWNHQKVLELKEIFNIDQAAKAEVGEQSETWEVYWQKILKHTEWADGYFIRATAWYLQMVIQIMDTKCKEDEPFYRIDGDFDDCCTDILYIGYVSEVHYQSILLDDYSDEDTDIEESVRVVDNDLKNRQNISVEEDSSVDRLVKDGAVIDDESSDLPSLEYQEEEKNDVSDSTSSKQEDNERCPSCRKNFKHVLKHIKKSKKCKVKDADIRRLEE